LRVAILIGSCGLCAHEGHSLTAYDLLQITDVAGMALSPDGRNVAVILRRANLTENAYDCELVVLDATGVTLPRSLGRIASRTRARSGFLRQTPQWSADGSGIFYLSGSEGVDQLWLQSAAGGAPRRLTSLPDDVLAFAVQPDGRNVLITTYELSGSDEERSRLVRSAKEEGMSWSPPILWGDYLGARGVQRYVSAHSGIQLAHRIVDAKNGHLSSVANLQGTADLVMPDSTDYDDYRYRFRDMGFASVQSPDRAGGVATRPVRDGRSAITRTERIAGERWSHVLVSDVASGKFSEWYRSRETSISSITWSADGARIYFVEQRYDGRGEHVRIYWIDRAGSAPTSVYATAARIESVIFDRATARAFALRSDARQPPVVVSVDLRTARERVLLDPNTWISERALPGALRLEWSNDFGARGFGMLLFPQAGLRADNRHRTASVSTNQAPAAPLVVVTYRASGFLRGGTGDEVPIYPLVAAGFAVLVLDIGETHATAQSRDSVDARTLRFRSQVSTVEAAMREACSHEEVDCSRAALTGLSFGAGLTWQTLIDTQLFRAAIVSDGGLSPFPFYMRGLSPPSRGVVPTSYLPVPVIAAEAKAAWSRVSTVENAGRIRAPVLVNDSDQEFAGSLDTFTAMQGLGKPLDVVIYPDAAHIINQPAQRFSIYKRNIDWLRFWLMDEEDPAPEKVSQYARWHILKEQHDWNEQNRAQGTDPGLEYMRQAEALTFGERVSAGDLAPMLRARRAD